MPSGAATSERASRTTTSEHGAVTTQTGRKLSSHSLFRSPGKKSPVTTGDFAIVYRSRKPVYVQTYRGFESLPLRLFVCLFV